MSSKMLSFPNNGTRVVLTGFMGVGKSSVARHLSGLLGCARVDLDSYIEESENRKIHEIIDADGLSAYREVETRNLADVLKNSNAQILGIPDEYFQVKDDVPFNLGRKTNPLDLDETRKVVVIGTTVAERLFAEGEDPVGKYIRVTDVLMKVVGVFHDKGGRGRNSERVLMPLTTMQLMYGGGEITDNIWVRPEKGVDGFELEKQVVALLKRRPPGPAERRQRDEATRRLYDGGRPAGGRR